MTRFENVLAHHQTIDIDAGIRLHILCWNPEDIAKPAALLLHGTGFVAATYDNLAKALLPHFRVYAYDRRGHGLSSKPEQAYLFTDFASDLIQLCEQLQLEAVYGIGHSAGATDMLIAEAERPGLFRKLFVMEPTINDPSLRSKPADEAVMNIQTRIDQARKRRHQFSSRTEVFENYRGKPLFQQWQPDALAAYIHYGFYETEDGTVALQCHPNIEAEILRSIFLAFNNAVETSEDSNPFSRMDRVRCPMAVSRSEHSGQQFAELARRAHLHFPHAKAVDFPELGHCVPQENPQLLAEAVMKFWSD